MSGDNAHSNINVRNRPAAAQPIEMTNSGISGLTASWRESLGRPYIHGVVCCCGATQNPFTFRPVSPIVAPMKIPALLGAALIACAALPAPATENTADTNDAKPVRTLKTAGYFERAGELVIHALALIGVNYKYGSEGSTAADS
jgi:hypothetical protein